MKKIAIFILMLTAMGAGSLSAASYSLRISSFTRNINLNYDLNGGVEISETITIKHKGDAVDFFLGFTSGTSTLWSDRKITYNSSTLSYQIYRDSSNTTVLKDVADSPSADEVLSGSFSASSSFQYSTLSYVVQVPPGQFDLAGTYGDNFDVVLYSGTLSTPVLESSKTHSLKVTMPASIELSVTQSGNPFDDSSTAVDMNFGILSAGAVRTADAIVRTNAPYSVFLLSDHRGKLVHSDPTVADTVPYTLSFNGSTVDLSGTSPLQVISGAAVTTWDGTVYPINVTIGDFGMATGGYYSDSITITVQAQ